MLFLYLSGLLDLACARLDIWMSSCFFVCLFICLLCFIFICFVLRALVCVLSCFNVLDWLLFDTVVFPFLLDFRVTVSLTLLFAGLSFLISFLIFINSLFFSFLLYFLLLCFSLFPTFFSVALSFFGQTVGSVRGQYKTSVVSDEQRLRKLLSSYLTLSPAENGEKRMVRRKRNWVRNAAVIALLLCFPFMFTRSLYPPFLLFFLLYL